MHNLASCDKERRFKLSDGREIGDLLGLHQSFNDMEDQVFNHHVNEYKNDFSTWVNDVLKDQKLAEDISKTKNKKVMQLLIRKKIVGHVVRNLFYRL